MDKQNAVYTFTVEYYSAIKRNEVLIGTTTLMNLGNIIFNERSLSQKTTCCLIPFIRNPLNRQIYGIRKWISGCQGLGQGGLGWILAGTGFLWGWGNVLELDSTDTCINLWIYNELYTLKEWNLM